MRIPLQPPECTAFLGVDSISVFRADECEAILDMVGGGQWGHARVSESDNAYGAVKPEVRSVVSQPLPLRADGWPMTSIVEAIQEANARLWRYELWGFGRSDYPSILRYEGEVQDHFRSHVDAGEFAASRKLSFSLQLSDPSKYLGGDLVISGQNVTGSREQGSLTVFSSMSSHEVTPVYSGRRHAVVGWVHGPTFR